MISSLGKILSIIALAGCTALSVCAQTTTTTSRDTSTATGTTKADHKTTAFLKDASRDNNMEVAMAEVAAQKAQNQELKTFAEMLRKDHTEAEQQLMPIAQKYGVTVEEATKVKNSGEVTKFQKEQSGAKWDQRFATESLKSHAKDIEKFQEAARDIQATDVKQYAETMLPKLRHHFEEAERIARTVGVDQSTISSYSKKVQSAVGGSSNLEAPSNTHIESHSSDTTK